MERLRDGNRNHIRRSWRFSETWLFLGLVFSSTSTRVHVFWPRTPEKQKGVKFWMTKEALAI